MQKVITDYESYGFRELWDYIEEHIPNFSTNTSVTYSDDLSGYLEGNAENSTYERYENHYKGDYESALEDLIENDVGLLADAMGNAAEETFFVRFWENALPAFQSIARDTIESIYRKTFVISHEK